MTASLNPYISLYDERFDAEKSSQYRMAIQFALGGLSFALLDTQANTLIALECYQSNLLSDCDDLFRTLERALEAKGLNNKSFQSVICLIDNRYCALVPDLLFNNDDRTHYLDFAFQLPNTYTIVSEHLESVSSHNVYAFLRTLHDKILAKWDNAHIIHSSSVFINSMMQNTLSNGVFVQVHNRDFDMLIKKDGNLCFFNNFKFNTKEDFAYFLLYAMEQNGISGQDTPVSFSGLIRPASDIIDLCGRYIRDIRFVDDPHLLQVSKALQEVPFPYYFIQYHALK